MLFETTTRKKISRACNFLGTYLILMYYCHINSVMYKFVCFQGLTDPSVQVVIMSSAQGVPCIFVPQTAARSWRVVRWDQLHVLSAGMA